MKALVWMGSSKTDWDSFPASVQDEAGYQLYQLQLGKLPRDWKPMKTIGPGICEVRIRDAAGAFRVIYLSTQPDNVYVLHVFRKKSQATSLHDLRLAQERFKSIPR